MVLCCELSKPGSSAQWKKDTVLLMPGNKYEMKQNGCELQLTIYDFNTEDCGVYKCCASKLETMATVGVKGSCSLLSLFCSVLSLTCGSFSACLLHCSTFVNNQQFT